MKILQVNAVNKVFSTGRTAEELDVVLESYGHKVFIAHATGVKDKYSYVIGTVLDHKIHALLSRLLGFQGYFSRIPTMRLLKFIKKENPNIVHLRNLHANYINLPMLLKYLAENNIATVLTLHDCWFYTGKCCYYTSDKCFKWQTECNNCPRLKKDNKSWFFDRTTKMYNDKKRLICSIPHLAVIGVSDWITAEARQSFLKSAQVLKRIYEWIDMDVFKPVPVEALKKQLGFNSNFIILGVATAWDDRKGVENFIQLAKFCSDNEIIIMIGKIDSKINLPAKIVNIDTTENVDELVQYYSLADVFVNFSMEETFGKVTAEALACGTPVVVVDSAASPELVVDGCGYIVPPNNIPETMNAISAFKKQRKENVSDFCRRHAVNMFSKDDRIADLIDVYKQLLHEVTTSRRIF